MLEEKRHKPVVRTYNLIAKRYDRIFASYLNGTFRVALDVLALKGGEKIIDVACGTGELEKRILDKFPQQHITGIDITKSMLDIARRKCKGFPNVQFLHAAGQKIPVNDASFNIAITCSAIHYMREPEKVLGECYRVLAPGGRLIIIDWCRDFLWAKFYHWLNKIYKRAHHKVYTLEEVEGMLGGADFTVTKTDTFSVKPVWRMMCIEAKKQANDNPPLCKGRVGVGCSF